MTAAKKKADAMARALRPYVDLLLVAMAFAQLEREKIDKIQRRLLATGAYGGDGDPKKVWTLPDEATDRFYADCHKEYLAAGYKVEPGYCPALIAEHKQVEAEWALIKAAEEFFEGVTNNQLLCGTKTMNGLETRQKYIDLLIGLVVNHPDYKPPHKR